jgi:hypothetical protein
MALTETQLEILKTELATDPAGLGYTSDDPTCATLLSTVGLSGETIDREVIDGQELSAAVVMSEYMVLSAAEQRAWMTVLAAGSGQIDVSNTNIRSQIQAIWGAGTTTRANLVALQTRGASRTEVLFGIGVSVGHLDVAKARVI